MKSAVTDLNKKNKLSDQSGASLLTSGYGTWTPKHRSKLREAHLQDIVSTVRMDRLMPQTRRSICLFYPIMFPISSVNCFCELVAVWPGRFRSTRNHMT